MLVNFDLNAKQYYLNLLKSTVFLDIRRFQKDCDRIHINAFMLLVEQHKTVALLPCLNLYVISLQPSCGLPVTSAGRTIPHFVAGYQRTASSGGRSSPAEPQL